MILCDTSVFFQLFHENAAVEAELAEIGYANLRAIAPNSEELENLEQKAIVTGGFLAFPFDTGHYVDFR